MQVKRNEGYLGCLQIHVGSEAVTVMRELIKTDPVMDVVSGYVVGRVGIYTGSDTIHLISSHGLAAIKPFLKRPFLRHSGPVSRDLCLGCLVPG